MSLAIGPWRILIVMFVALIFSIGIFALAYFIDKNLGHKKAMREKETTSYDTI